MWSVAGQWRTAVLVGVLFGHVFGHAEVQQKRYGTRGMGYFGIGVQGIEWGGLREKLQQYGYGDISRLGLVIGGGGGGVIGPLFLGGEGYGLVGRAVTGTSGQVRGSGGWGSFLVGWFRSIGERVHLHVQGGLGGGSIRVLLQRGDGVAPFDSLLQQPRGVVSMVASGLILQGGVGAEVGLISGLFVGVRAGYVLPLGWGALALESEEGIAGAPAVTLRGWSVRFVLGATHTVGHQQDGD